MSKRLGICDDCGKSRELSGCYECTKDICSGCMFGVECMECWYESDAKSQKDD